MIIGTLNSLSRRHQRNIRLAQLLSYKSTCQHRLGCIIVRGTKVLGVGFNSLRTHTKSRTMGQTIHAELSAILNTGERILDNCVVYLFRQKKNGTTGIAKPCKICEAYLKELRVRKVYYTIDNNILIEEKY